jgi:small GTP-binding protein
MKKNTPRKQYPRPIYKIIISGDGGVGKSTLLKTRVNKKYTPVDQLTIGVDFDCYAFEAADDSMTLLAFDLGGQDHFWFIHQAFITGAKAGLILYDLTKFSTFLHIPHWVELLQSEYPSMPLLIIGTKKDLVDEIDLENTKIEWEHLRKELPKSANIVNHFQISSTNVEDTKMVFKEMQKIAANWKKQMEQQKKIGVASK